MTARVLGHSQPRLHQAGQADGEASTRVTGGDGAFASDPGGAGGQSETAVRRVALKPKEDGHPGEKRDAMASSSKCQKWLLFLGESARSGQQVWAEKAQARAEKTRKTGHEGVEGCHSADSRGAPASGPQAGWGDALR